MEIRTIGIDLAKTVFHFVAVNARAKLCFARSARALSCFASPRTFEDA